MHVSLSADIICYKMQTVSESEASKLLSITEHFFSLLLPKKLYKAILPLNQFWSKNFFYFTVVSFYTKVSVSELYLILAIRWGLDINKKISVRRYEYLKCLGLTTSFSGDRAHMTLELVPGTFLSSCIGHVNIFTIYEIVYEASLFYFS